MAATGGGGGKKGKKKKGKTVALTEFLSQDASTTPYIAPARKVDWADESEDPSGEINLEYGPPKPVVDLSKLPSAPRASRGVEIDYSRLPSQPPYTAFVGNLPFDVTEEDIRNLFRGLRVENIRFPQDGNRMKGFGYAEFFDLEQLKRALALNNVEKIRNRPIRVDIAGKEGGRDGGMTRDGGRQFDDKTAGDWRRDDGGGGGGFSSNRMDDRRDNRGYERRDGDFRRPLQSAADTDDQWRRDDRNSQPSTNGWGGDGGRRFDDRGGRFDDRFDRGGSRFDDRRRDRYDDKGFGRYDDQRGGDRYDDRRDYRGGRYDDTRGDRGFGSGFRDGPRGGHRDDGRGRYDDYGGRGGYDRGGRGPDSGEREPPKERPKLNLQPRKEPEKTEETEEKKSSSIFGAARPVDTAAKERAIEEKLMKERSQVTRGRGDERGFQERDDSRDRDRRDNYRRDISRDRDRRDNYRRDGSREEDRRNNYRRDGSRDRDRRDNFSRDTNRDWDRRDNYSRSDSRDRSRRDGDPRDGNYDRDRRDNYARDNSRDRDRRDDHPRSGDRDRDRRDHYDNSDRYRSPNRDTDSRSPNRSPSYRSENRYDSREPYNDELSGARYDRHYGDTCSGGEDDEGDNWRDERVRHDRPRVMRPDLVTNADTKERSLSESSDKGRDDMAVLRKSADKGSGRNLRDKRSKDGPIISPMYEEPQKPVFIQNSKFAALDIEDDGGSGEDGDIECP